VSITPNSTTTHSLQGKAVLRIISNNSAIIVEQKLTKPLINIGRDTSNDIAIDEDIISSYHFQIQESNGLYYLIHPSPLKGETSNGFSFQGKLYHGKEQFKHPLTNGDVFRIGDPSGSDGSIVSVTFDDGSGDVLDILTPDYEVALNKVRITIGRGADNDVHLKCDTSRSIRIEAQSLYRIVKGKEKDTTKKKDKALLRDVSLVIPSRSFIALVGGSGAGKSTLLCALNGLGPAHDTILYNGYDYYKSYAAFSTPLGYVPQDDIVHRELTVQDALYYGTKQR